jgi:nitrogen fixation-related uncharacterized protein
MTQACTPAPPSPRPQLLRDETESVARFELGQTAQCAPTPRLTLSRPWSVSCIPAAPENRKGRRRQALAVTLALFAAGIALGIAGALVWVWAVRSGQFKNLEETKQQLFWPDLAEREKGEKTK